MRRARTTAGLVISAVLLSQLTHVTPAAAEVIGLVRATGVSLNNSDDLKYVVANCPDGTVLLSGGYQINGATGEVVVDDMWLTNPNTLTLSVYEEDPYANPWSVTAYAICAEEPSGLTRRTEMGDNNSQGFKSVTLVCPLGKVLLGAGYMMNGAAGEATIDDLFPNATPATIAVNAYETDIDYPANWFLTTHAVCASPLPGLTRREAESAENSTDSRSVTASCLAGEVMVGSGYQLQNGQGNVVVDDLRPNGDEDTAPTAVTVWAYEADPGYVDNWQIVAHALCADLEG